jgi:hypothetical protein
MKKVLKIIAVVLFLAFVGIQFIRPDMTNPPIIVEQTLESSTNVPENVQKILTRSCNDCHTNNTNYPGYSKISPGSLFMANHIKDGRRSMNFSEWGSYETRRKRKKLDQICEQISTNEMPLPSYLWIHWSAKLSDDDVKTLCDWAEGERAKLLETPDSAATPAPNN